MAKSVEGAGGDQAFEDPAVDELGIDPEAEILKAFERPVTAHVDNVLDRRLAELVRVCDEVDVVPGVDRRVVERVERTDLEPR